MIVPFSGHFCSIRADYELFAFSFREGRSNRTFPLLKLFRLVDLQRFSCALLIYVSDLVHAQRLISFVICL